MENLTLDCYFEGLIPAMELKQSSKETLDYMAHLTWIRVLKSNWFRKSVLKRFGTLPKKPRVQNCINMISAFIFNMVYAYVWNQQ